MATIALAILLAAALVALAVSLRRGRRRERRMKAILEQLPESAVSVFGTDLRLEEVHGEALRPAHLEPGDFIGRRIDEVFDGATGRKLIGAQTAALSGEKSGFEITSPVSGRQFWVRVAPLVEHGDI